MRETLVVATRPTQGAADRKKTTTQKTVVEAVAAVRTPAAVEVTVVVAVAAVATAVASANSMSPG